MNNQLPSSIEAEQSILGSIILEPSLMGLVSNRVKPSMFFKEVHKIIYESILEIYQEKNPIDIIAIIESLKAKGFIEKVGGLNYITSLTTIVPTTTNIEYYINILIDKSNRRVAISTLKTLEDKIHNEKIETLKTEINELKGIFDNNGKIKDMIVDASQIKRNKEFKNYIPTGIKMLDNFLGGGFRFKSLNVITGVPGSGKSTILNQLIANAIKNNHKSFLYSGELPESDLMFWFNRTVANENHIDTKHNKDGKPYFDVSDYCWEQVSNWVKDRFKIYGSHSKATTGNILSVIEYLATREGYKFFVLDNLMTFDIGDSTKQYQMQKQLCLALKELAKSLDLVIILVAHPRKTENKNGKNPQKPSMYDVSGASEIVGSADTILMTDRETFKDDTTGEIVDKSKILILKNRWASICNRFIALQFDEKRKRFYQSMDELTVDYGYDENTKFEQLESGDFPF
ncbi:MAG: DnaB-like helicase N-terminal domain-containing protein [Peptostreptococcaceae bacterium]